MTLTTGTCPSSSCPSPSPSPSNPNLPTANSEQQGQGEGQEKQRDLASVSALVASLAPRIRALMAQNPLRVSLGGLAVMQPDPARAHVLYVELELRSADGRRLRAVCGTCCFSFFFSETDALFFPTAPLRFLPLERARGI